jgi:hypothetical protein
VPRRMKSRRETVVELMANGMLFHERAAAVVASHDEQAL